MSKHTPVAVTLSTALAGLALSGATFAMQPLAQGYMLAASEPVATTEAAKADEGKCGEGKCGIAQVDTDKDGRVSRAEFNAAHPDKAAQFATIDSNGDGYLDEAERTAHHAAKVAEGNCGGKKADPTEAKAGEGKCGAEGKCGEGKCGGMA